MALSTFGSVHLYIVLLLVSVSSRVLVRGEVGLCTEMGCRCTESYVCCLEVSEEIPNATVGSATIHPAFGMISGDFRVVDSSLLTIDPVSGEITTNGAIDREGLQQDCVLLEVTLNTPSGLIGPHIFAVNINDINDNSPEFQSQEYEFTVDESEPKSDLVCDSSLRAIDQDLGSVTYRVISPSGNFTIDKSTTTDEVCISSHIDLDRDSDPSSDSVSLTIEARDQGNNSNTAMVVLMIADINDNAPVFVNKSVMLKVPESQQLNSIIMRLEATDNDVDEANRMIRYSLIPEHDSFRIDPVTGDLLLTEELDYETAEENPLLFTVQATDMGDSLKNDSSVVTIIIQDINELANQRILVESDTIMEESIASGNILSFGLFDQDSPANNNNFLNFLSGGEYFNYTHLPDQMVPGVTEIFHVQQVVPIDREEQSVIELIVEVVEGGYPELRRTINLTIDILDINDNRPELTQNFFQLLENNTPGTQIVHVPTIASDRDSGKNGTIVEYNLISVTGCSDTTEESCTRKDLTEDFNNVLSDFKTNGLLVAPNLDREGDGPYLRIVLELIDGGVLQLSANHSLTLELLDMNDESPAFQPIRYQFSLLEERSQSIIGSVTAVDRDNGSNGTITYALTEPSEDFKINEDTGEISNLRSFDRETTRSITIFVTARDKGDPPNNATNMAEVMIEITDINDNVPAFIIDSQEPIIFTISTDAAVGVRVGQVIAKDLDLDENAEVFFRIEPSVFFSISNGSGYITVAQPLTNQEKDISLTVTAFNAGQEGNSLNITITVTSSAGVPLAVIIAIAAGGTVLLIAIVIVSICILFFYRKNRKGKLEFTSPDGSLNNGRPGSPKGILVQIPNPTQRRGSGRVAFDEKVQKMVYDHKQSVTCDEAVYKVESNTNFGSGDEASPRIHHNGNIPTEGQQLTNGMPPSLYNHRTHQRSPIMLQEEEVGHPELSENSTIDEQSHFHYDGNSDEESTLSDDASNMNVQIPRFRSPEEHTTNLSSSIRYANTYPHQQLPSSPLHLVGPIPSIEYHESLPHAYQPPLSDHSLTLTPPHSPHSHNIPSPMHSPAHQISSLGCAPTSTGSFITALNGTNRSNYPMVMPSAFSRGTPDVHMFEERYMASYSDYDTSTCASSELDEALNFPPEMEPGNYSLTDVYSGDEDTEL